jgi:hypothetical protein
MEYISEPTTLAQGTPDMYLISSSDSGHKANDI